MKTGIILFCSLFLLMSNNGFAQGAISFNSSTQTVSTNSVIGGVDTGTTTTQANKFYYALYYSASATSVGGQTAAIVGAANNNYAFNDSNWKFAGYATNSTTFTGRITGKSSLVISNIPVNSTGQFVIVGWSASIGSDINTVKNWFNAGDPVSDGWIGQSAVSGAISLGGGVYPTPFVMGSSAPQIQGFMLGRSGGLFTPAYVVTQPTNQTISVGGTVIFTVVANGDPSLPIACQWRLNGTNISAGGNYSTTGTNYFDFSSYAMRGIFTLTITNVQGNNAGNYSAVVANTAGSDTSSNGLLTVTGITGLPPSIISQPQNQTVAPGSNAAFSVSASGSDPLSYQWLFNGNNIGNATNASLVLNSVQTNNAGNYSVLVFNAYGSTNSFEAQLIVQIQPPQIVTQPQNRSVLAGTTVTFSVNASGSAPLSYQWSFNGSPINGATGTSLTIANAQAGNAGNYLATVSNALGATNSATATLTIVPSSGYVRFVNSVNSATKIFTNSYVGGQVSGLTATNPDCYYYGLFASTNTSSVNGTSEAILGAASANYAFLDSNWTLVAYGKNNPSAGRLISISTDNFGLTPVVGFASGTSARFVLVGWSANVATNNISAVQAWFNIGFPMTDGWIGQSAVSGLLLLGDGGPLPSPQVMAAYPPALQGFTLGLASPNPGASYPPPGVPAPKLSTTLIGNSVKLSWPAFYSSYGLQSAASTSGPWSDLGTSPVPDGTNLSVTVSTASLQPFYRLIVQ